MKLPLHRRDHYVDQHRSATFRTPEKHISWPLKRELRERLLFKMPILLPGENLLVSICVLPKGLQETRAYHCSPLGQSKKAQGICSDKGLLFTGPAEIGPEAG